MLFLFFFYLLLSGLLSNHSDYPEYWNDVLFTACLLSKLCSLGYSGLALWDTLVIFLVFPSLVTSFFIRCPTFFHCVHKQMYLCSFLCRELRGFLSSTNGVPLEMYIIKQISPCSILFPLVSKIKRWFSSCWKKSLYRQERSNHSQFISCLLVLFNDIP